MSMKKPAVLLAFVGACALAFTGPVSVASPLRVGPVPAEDAPASSTTSRTPKPGDHGPARSGTLRWTLACVASWMLVATFVGVLVFAWSHLGASGAIYDDAKEHARSAQQERDSAQSTLDDINRQIEEAEK